MTLSKALHRRLPSSERRAELIVAANHLIVSRHGLVLHVRLSDLHNADDLDPVVLRRRDRIVRCLARVVRRELKLPAKQTIAAINMITTVPEEGGSLVFAGRVNSLTAKTLCAELVVSAVQSLRPDPQISAA